MTERLVSEARPIPWAQLSTFEQELIKNEADTWIQAVVNDSARKKTKADALDESRSGRVLFIDGPRGAGKTSLLLTLLKRWTGDVENDKKEEKGPCNKDLHVLWPILDFDPLPPGMPLHGWLLEPWRREAKKLDQNAKTSRRDAMDLTESLAELFERAVTGWTPTHAEGKGVVEKALAYQEKASGWIDTKQLWRDFVGAMLCHQSGCEKDGGTHAHRCVYVVAIDDVDLQVEHLPQLLHAVRLLEHPNVAYVLTGNYDHLRFVLKLDYMRRHGYRMHTHRRDEQQIDDELWNGINAHSDRLRDALIEKALPSHARLTLPHLSLEDVLKFDVAGKTIKDELDSTTLNAIPDAARLLPIVTARQAQHAIDRHLANPKRRSTKKDAASHDLMADLCGTTIEAPKKDHEKGSEGKPPGAQTGEKVTPKFAIRGALTTWSGPTLRALKGDQLKIVLTEQPLFVFHPDFDDTGIRDEALAHRALLIQLMVEQKEALVVAHALEWRPDEGIVKTEVEWRPGSKEVGPTAVFHWPRLVRLSAAEALDLGTLSKRMNYMAGNSLSHLTEDTIAVWLLENVNWQIAELMREGKEPSTPKRAQYRQPKGAPPEGDHTLKDFEDRLKPLWTEVGAEIQTEIKRWLRELYVMTAPYFGLPPLVVDAMRKTIQNCAEYIRGDGDDVLLPDELRKAQDTIINDAITARATSGRKSRQPESASLPSDDELKKLTQLFLARRKERSRKDAWWEVVEPTSASERQDSAVPQ